ncbi:hypothetical protein SESBI_44872 [Sesbania bispinosa]|nr:hypothetical protein SESBI_44872 [Sesbania bispinosa]
MNGMDDGFDIGPKAVVEENPIVEGSKVSLKSVAKRRLHEVSMGIPEAVPTMHDIDEGYKSEELESGHSSGGSDDDGSRPHYIREVKFEKNDKERVRVRCKHI